MRPAQERAVAAWLADPRIGLAVTGDTWRRESVVALLARASGARRLPSSTGLAVLDQVPAGDVVSVGSAADLADETAVVLADHARVLVAAPSLADLHPKLASRCGLVLDLPHDPAGAADVIMAFLADDAAAPSLPGPAGPGPAPEADRLAATVTAFGIRDQRIDVAAGLVAATLAGLGHDERAIDETLVECVLLPRATRVPEPEPESAEPEAGEDDDASGDPGEDGADGERDEGPDPGDGSTDSSDEDDVESPGPAGVPLPGRPSPARRRLRRAPTGRRGGVLEPAPSGRTGRVLTSERPRSAVAVMPSLREAARWHRGDGGVRVRPEHLRWAYRRRPSGRLTIFVVDSSGSMARESIRRAKAEAIALLDAACQRRDRVAIVLVSGREAAVGLHPTRSAERARHCLRRLPTGGGTPLASGLLRAAALASPYDPGAVEVVVLTDGRPNVGLDGTRQAAHDDAERAAVLLRSRAATRRVTDLSRRGQQAQWLAALLA